MKKALLIAAGTVTGLGAVLSITPPALSESVGSVGITGGSDLGAATAPAQSVATPATSTPDPSKSVTSATPTPSATATATAVPTPTPTPTKSAAPTGASGTFTGSSYAARNYGNVSVSATFTNGKLTSVSATQSPMSWAQQSFSVLVPWVNAGNITVEQVKQYSSAQLPCATSNSCNSRASYTAEAFWASLKSAITKAGL